MCYLGIALQILNILDFVGHRVPVATFQLCHSNTKAAIDKT